MREEYKRGLPTLRLFWLIPIYRQNPNISRLYGPGRYIGLSLINSHAFSRYMRLWRWFRNTSFFETKCRKKLQSEEYISCALTTASHYLKKLVKQTLILIANKTTTLIENIFYSTFRLMPKQSWGINEMQQLERKNKDHATLRHSLLHPYFFLLTVAFHWFLMMAYA